VVTFLFTDVEGSTRRWEADAAAMRAALMAHDEVLRAAIQAHDGFLFSHTGDGVVVSTQVEFGRFQFGRAPGGEPDVELRAMLTDEIRAMRRPDTP
jgi:class 3 adenylate cyclase